MSQASQAVDALRAGYTAEQVLDAWSLVCEENESEKHLVSKSQYHAWSEYRMRTNAEMAPFIQRPYGPDFERFIESIATMLTSMSHRSKAELEKQAGASVEQAAKRGRLSTLMNKITSSF